MPENTSGAKNKSILKEKLEDFKMLADVCSRAGKTVGEANANLSMGIIYDNCKEWKKVMDIWITFFFGATTKLKYKYTKIHTVKIDKFHTFLHILCDIL